MNRERIKKIAKRLFCLPPVPTLLISIPAYGLVIYALAGKNVKPYLAYLSYFVSAYALIISITGISGIVRLVRQGIDQHPLVRKALGVPLVSRYLREDMFRAQTGLYQGFLSTFCMQGSSCFPESFTGRSGL